MMAGLCVCLWVLLLFLACLARYVASNGAPMTYIRSAVLAPSDLRTLYNIPSTASVCSANTTQVGCWSL
jgi:hypothetical protein